MTLPTLISLVMICTASARELTGPKAKALFDALVDAGYEGDNYAGGMGVQGTVRCQMSRNAPPAEAYHCEVPVAAPEETVAAPQPTPALNPDALDKAMEKETSLIREGRLADARQGLSDIEKKAGPTGDYAEKAQALGRYLVCEEGRVKGDGGSPSRDKIESDVLYALKVNDPRRLATLIACDAELARPNSEPETPYVPQTVARTVLAQREGAIKVGSRGAEEITTQGYKNGAELTLQFRAHGPSGRWYLHRVGFPIP